MATGKTSTLTRRVAPASAEALRPASDRERRSIANMIGVLMGDHCARKGITIHEPAALFSGDEMSSATP